MESWRSARRPPRIVDNIRPGPDCGGNCNDSNCFAKRRLPHTQHRQWSPSPIPAHPQNTSQGPRACRNGNSKEPISALVLRTPGLVDIREPIRKPTLIPIRRHDPPRSGSQRSSHPAGCMRISEGWHPPGPLESSSCAPPVSPSVKPARSAPIRSGPQCSSGCSRYSCTYSSSASSPRSASNITNRVRTDEPPLRSR